MIVQSWEVKRVACYARAEICENVCTYVCEVRQDPGFVLRLEHTDFFPFLLEKNFFCF